MSQDQILALINAVNADSDLEGRLRAAEDLSGALAIAKEAGFMISEEEAKLYLAQQNDEELSETELTAVAGGGKGYFGSPTVPAPKFNVPKELSGLSGTKMVNALIDKNIPRG